MPQLDLLTIKDTLLDGPEIISKGVVRLMHSDTECTAIFPRFTHRKWDEQRKQHSVQIELDEYRIPSRHQGRVSKEGELTSTSHRAYIIPYLAIRRWCDKNNEQNERQGTGGQHPKPRERNTDIWPELSQEFGDIYAELVRTLTAEDTVVIRKEEQELFSTSGRFLMLNSQGRLQETDDPIPNLPGPQHQSPSEHTINPVHLPQAKDTWAIYDPHEYCRCHMSLKLTVPDHIGMSLTTANLTAAQYSSMLDFMTQTQKDTPVMLLTFSLSVSRHQ